MTKQWEVQIQDGETTVWQPIDSEEGAQEFLRDRQLSTGVYRSREVEDWQVVTESDILPKIELVWEYEQEGYGSVTHWIEAKDGEESARFVANNNVTMTGRIRRYIRITGGYQTYSNVRENERALLHMPGLVKRLVEKVLAQLS